MSQKKKIVFILNPISGTKKKELVPELIRNHLNHQLYDYEIAKTERAFHAQELAKGAAEAGADIVVAVGGDGTVNEVGSGLLYSNVSLGILPFGSGNGLALHLGIPVDTAEAIKLLNKGRCRSIDAGIANGKPFFCTAGLGFDAHIGQLFAHTHTRGFASYIRLALREYFRFQPHHYNICLADKKISGSFFVLTAANAGQYGNNAYIAPEADIEDGFLDICLLKPFAASKLIGLGWKLFRKKIHKSSYMQIHKAKKIEIDCPQSECMHLDGEFAPVKGKLTIEALPKSLNVLIS